MPGEAACDGLSVRNTAPGRLCSSCCYDLVNLFFPLARRATGCDGAVRTVPPCPQLAGTMVSFPVCLFLKADNRRAQFAKVLSARHSSTLRQVLEYSPQSTPTRPARRSRTLGTAVVIPALPRFVVCECRNFVRGFLFRCAAHHSFLHRLSRFFSLCVPVPVLGEMGKAERVGTKEAVRSLHVGMASDGFLSGCRVGAPPGAVSECRSFRCGFGCGSAVRPIPWCGCSLRHGAVRPPVRAIRLV